MVAWKNILQYQFAKVELKCHLNFIHDPNYINKCVYVCMKKQGEREEREEGEEGKEREVVVGERERSGEIEKLID